MKVLFINELKEATFSAIAPNANYPASNLVHVFAKVKYKGVGYSDTITATLPDNVTASGFFYTYSNATSMTLRLYSNESVLLDTLTVDCTYDSGSVFFTEYSNVRWIEIDASSSVSEDLYIGGMALGVAIDFVKPDAAFDIALVDNSAKVSSTDGQVSYHYIKPLRKYDLTFSGVKRMPDFHDIVGQFEDIGSGNLWVDITEEKHSVYKPIYCTTDLYEKPGSNLHIVSFGITITEAR